MHNYTFDYRRLGPAGLDAYLRQHGAGPAPELDRICAQRDAHTARLYWFTDLPAATAEARRARRPILSLRLLGRLDEELSCANSRFFRKLLYVDPAINALLRDHFVLHWQSVRPVPIVTIDFGNTKIVRRTLTGNSVHLVLDPDGNPIDALPGLFDPQTFRALLLAARAIPTKHLAAHHARAARTPPPLPPTSPAPAMAASAVAMTKHIAEMPLLRAVAHAPLALETAANHALHLRIHDHLATTRTSLDDLVAWIYRTLFLMPTDDPALGLDQPDPY